MNPLLSIEDLHIEFQSSFRKVLAVSGVNIKLYKGETLGIVGESGCGKSATARSITKLLPGHVAKYSGKVLYQGADLLEMTEKQIRRVRGREIGMILQDPMTCLNPTMRIAEQIIEGFLQHHPGAKRADALEKAIEMLHLVGIPSPKERIKCYPHMLSGGMRQRVLIAIALACRPSILIADEPTTALDVTIQAQILNLLKDLKDKLQMSMLLITHDLAVIAALCDRVSVMYAGKVVEEASVDELFYTPRHPYTQRLFAAIPKIHESSDIPLTPIDGHPPTFYEKEAGCSFAPRCPHAMKICQMKCPPSASFSATHTASCWLYHIGKS
jgi:oligopeptide transport system ATP-binding protein